MTQPGKDAEGVDWENEASHSYAWAGKNTRIGDEKKAPDLRDPRAYAAAALFRLTGDKAYEEQCVKDTAEITPAAAVFGFLCGRVEKNADK